MYYLQFLNLGDEEGIRCYIDRDHKEEILVDIETGFTDVCYIKNTTVDFVISRVEREEARKTIEEAYRDHWALDDVNVRLGQERALFPNSYYGKNNPIFECDGFNAVILCALWYLLAHKYRLQECKHCGKLYLTKDRNSKFCSRKSPMPRYKMYSCADAVHQLKDTLAKEAKKIYNAKYSSGLHYEELQEFINGVNKYKDIIRDAPSYSNCHAYKNFVKGRKGPV